VHTTFHLQPLDRRTAIEVHDHQAAAGMNAALGKLLVQRQSTERLRSGTRESDNRKPIDKCQPSRVARAKGDRFKPASLKIDVAKVTPSGIEHPQLVAKHTR